MTVRSRSEGSATGGRAKSNSGDSVMRPPSTWTSTTSIDPAPAGRPPVAPFALPREIDESPGAILAGLIGADRGEFAAAWAVMPIRTGTAVTVRTARG